MKTLNFLHLYCKIWLQTQVNRINIIFPSPRIYYLFTFCCEKAEVRTFMIMIKELILFHAVWFKGCNHPHIAAITRTAILCKFTIYYEIYHRDIVWLHGNIISAFLNCVQ